MTTPAPATPLAELPNAFAEACRAARSEIELYERCRAVLVRHFGNERVWLSLSSVIAPPRRLGPDDGFEEAVAVAAFTAGTSHVAIHGGPEIAPTMRGMAMPLSVSLAVLAELREVLVDRQTALDDAAFQLRALRQVSRLLSSVHSVSETEQLILDFMAEVFGTEWACLYRPEADHYVARVARLPAHHAVATALDRAPLDAAVPSGPPTPASAGAISSRVGGGVQLCVPLEAGDERVAILAFGPRRGARAYGRAEFELAQTLAVAAAFALRNAELVEQLHSAATTDELTGLMNRRALEDRLSKELTRGERHQLNTSVVLVDIDRFKAVNDTLGHAAGDRLLRLVANVLRRECRALDVVGRLGGDEFLAILPMTNGAEARIYAARVQASLAALEAGHPELGIASASMGVAQAPIHGRTTGSLLAAADLALYKAKRTGRNAVEIAEA